jgi:probable phosphoglycerate mutase
VLGDDGDVTTHDPQLVLVRHGETAWSQTGQHTGTSDIPLTPHGEEEARLVAATLASRADAGQRFATILTSPYTRARTTAAIAGYGEAIVDNDLAEWDYGPVEGRTSDDVSAELGHDWEIFRDGVRVVPPGREVSEHPTAGETLDDVAIRVGRVIDAVDPVVRGGSSVLVFAHGHLLRVLAAVWLQLPPSAGALLELGTASTSVLGIDPHGTRALVGWNLPPG